MSKDEFVKALISEGFNAGYSNNGIPTIFVKDALDIHEAHKAVKKAIQKLGYVQSYGISLSNPLESSN